MPRIHPRILWQANAIDSLLPRLLPICRDVPSARNELRWLREHANEISKASSSTSRLSLLEYYVHRRARGEPLQYVLGSEYFGNLEIKCRPGVLIPRQETAHAVMNLVSLLMPNSNHGTLPSSLRVLDLCTGTGCIPLLFQHEFYGKLQRSNEVSLGLVGVDISPKALALAYENKAQRLQHHISDFRPVINQRTAIEGMTFLQADVLRTEVFAGSDASLPPVKAFRQAGIDPTFDILISNPPYVSSRDYRRTTSRSVRDFEPKLALVPPSVSALEQGNDGDSFYPQLLRIAEEVKARVLLFEVADLVQAKRVAAMALARSVWDCVEIWRDEPAVYSSSETSVINGKTVDVLGSGNGRSVFAYRGSGKAWMRRR